MERATYEIGGKKFHQEELVLCQEEALAEYIYPLLESGTTEAKQLIEVLLLEKRGLRKALAVVLIPDGETVESRDLAAEEAHFAAHLKLSVQARIVKDFFETNAAAAKELLALGSLAKAEAAPAAPRKTSRPVN